MKHLYVSAIFSLALVSYLATSGGSEYILKIYPKATTYHRITDVKHASIVPIQEEDVSTSIELIKKGRKLIQRKPGSERFALDK